MNSYNIYQDTEMDIIIPISKMTKLRVASDLLVSCWATKTKQ